jgi:hypothetical protein
MNDHGRSRRNLIAPEFLTLVSRDSRLVKISSESETLKTDVDIALSKIPLAEADEKSQERKTNH